MTSIKKTLMFFIVLTIVLASTGAFAGILLTGLGHASTIKQAYPLMLRLSILFSSPAFVGIVAVMIWKLITKIKVIRIKSRK